MKKIILIMMILISIGFGTYMFKKSNYVHSEAVFVATDSLTNLAFKIDGKIDKMTKEEGDKIEKGELLASLETKILNTKLDEINYKIKSQSYNLQSINIKKQKLINDLTLKKEIASNEIKQLNSKLALLEYQIKANQSRLAKLKFDKDKFYRLYKNKRISYDKYEKINSEYLYLFNMINAQKESIKVLKLSQSSANKDLELLKNEFKNVDMLDKEIKVVINQIDALNSLKKGILIKLNDSKLVAPFDGVVAKKFVNTNRVIKKGTLIYSVVNPKDIYIKVLLSERKIANVKIGASVIVKLDAFDDKFNGVVENIMPVSASTFSLVPRDIASGEFTKLDQRFIIKIKIQYQPKMRIGMGGEVKIKVSK